jgi:hypothetical protein
MTTSITTTTRCVHSSCVDRPSCRGHCLQQLLWGRSELICIWGSLAEWNERLKPVNSPPPPHHNFDNFFPVISQSSSTAWLMQVNLGQCFRLGHNHFLPQPFQFNIHYLHSLMHACLQIQRSGLDFLRCSVSGTGST